MSVSLNTTKLTTTLGNYFREQKAEFMPRVAQELTSLAHLSLKQVKDELPLMTIGGPNLVQPNKRDNAWNPTNNGVEFQPRILKVRAAKADLSFIPAELWATYLGSMAKRGATDQQYMPFESFIMDYIIGRVAEDVEDNVIFRGIYNAAGTAPADVSNGFLKIITDEIASTGIPAAQINTGAAITTSNAYDQVLAVYKIVPPKLRNRRLKAFVSYDTYDKFNEDYAASFTAAPYNTAFEKVMLNGTQCELVPLSALGTSSRIIITPEENFCVGMDLEGDMANIKVQENRRGMDVMVDFSIGVQIHDLRNVFVNGQP
jgi:hypothetical protein